MQPLPEAFPDVNGQLPPDGGEVVIPLYVEDVAVSRQRIETAVVRVERRTRTRNHLVDEQVKHERIQVERVSIGQYVDVVPPVREEGDVTIVSVVDEVLVTKRKLLLREEVHIRRVLVTERHVETVQLREQEAVVTRLPAPEELPPLLPEIANPSLEKNS